MMKGKNRCGLLVAVALLLPVTAAEETAPVPPAQKVIPRPPVTGRCGLPLTREKYEAFCLRMLMRFDANGDGRVDEAEMQAYEESHRAAAPAAPRMKKSAKK